MTSAIDQLESRVHDLINKIGQLHGENQRLGDELSLSRQDFQSQARELEQERQRHQEAVAAFQAASLGGGESELSERIDYQAQQIQLLERERLNLRDQITFLQTTLQNKEKDWQGKLDALNRQNEEQTAVFEAGQVEHQQQLQEAEQRLQAALAQHRQQLQTEQDEKQRLNDQLAEQESSLNTQMAAVLSLQEQLDAAAVRQTEQQADFANQLQAKQEEAETKLLQEQERFRMEYALLAQKHEQNLSDLTQAMNIQKERLVDERQRLQQEINQLDGQVSHYRQLLTDSAADIRRLLERLPLPESENDSTGETA